MTWQTHTLLIVDDNINNLRFAMTHLKAYSYKVLTASTGEDGIARAKLTLPDLILLDVMMPDIDGYEVCARLKANPTTQDIPIIFMTAISDASHKTRGLREGAVDYVTKPVDESELLMRVRTHLELRDLRLGAERKVDSQKGEIVALTQQIDRLRVEKETLYETITAQTEQINRWAQQTMQERVRDNRGVQLFIRNQIQNRMSQALQKLEAIQDRGQTAVSDEVQALVGETLSLFQELEGEFKRLTDSLSDSPQMTRAELYQTLSDREYQTLVRMARGQSNAVIADKMGVTPATISTYLRRIKQKLEITDGQTLLQVAFMLKLDDDETG